MGNLLSGSQVERPAVIEIPRNFAYPVEGVTLEPQISKYKKLYFKVQEDDPNAPSAKPNEIISIEELYDFTWYRLQDTQHNGDYQDGDHLASEPHTGGTNQVWEVIATTMGYRPILDDVDHVLRLKIEPVHRSELACGAKTTITQTGVVVAFPAPPPPRKIMIAPDNKTTSGNEWSVCSYSVESNLITAIYPMTKTYALFWAYRKLCLLRELLTYNTTFICLQGVEREHFYEFFQPQLYHLGQYEGTWQAMDIRCANPSGFATFWKRSKFRLKNQFCTEFDLADSQFDSLRSPKGRLLEIPVQASDTQAETAVGKTFHQFWIPAMTCEFSVIDGPSMRDSLDDVASTDTKTPREEPVREPVDHRRLSQDLSGFNTTPNLTSALQKTVILTNVHIPRGHNPHFKVIQLDAILSKVDTYLVKRIIPKIRRAQERDSGYSNMSEMKRALTDEVLKPQIPVIFAGQLNAAPASSAYQFMANGRSPSRLPKVERRSSLMEHELHLDRPVVHSLNLASAYSELYGEEQTFIKGKLGENVRVTSSYIWYNVTALKPRKALELPKVCLPSEHYCSDDASIVAEFGFESAPPSNSHLSI